MKKYRQTESSDIYSSECEALLASPDELSAYIDKELPVWKRHLIRRHLKKCEICADRVQRLQQTDSFLRHAGEVEVSDDFLSGVMARASEAALHQRQHDSLRSHVARFVETSLGWTRHLSPLMGSLRYNIRTRSPVYIFILTFAVFTMVGVTLYPPSGDKLLEKSHELELNAEKLISFEVIQPEPPKRLLTTYLQGE
ncbi:MAG: zf-HC2 domain-containing protein [Candidatus Poribacteria bacterium]|nr:zf-HC2 domain-containing protein [Candidatus Poribacteria bacterium]